MRQRVLALTLAAIVAAGCALAMTAATAHAASPATTHAVQAQRVDPEPLWPILRNFSVALARDGGIVLIRTAVDAVRARAKLHVKTFTTAIIKLYKSEDTWERAAVGSMCSFVDSDYSTGFTVPLSNDAWTDLVYKDMRERIGGPAIFWKTVGPGIKKRVRRWVAMANMAATSPQTLPGYYRACGLT